MSEAGAVVCRRREGGYGKCYPLFTHFLDCPTRTKSLIAQVRTHPFALDRHRLLSRQSAPTALRAYQLPPGRAFSATGREYHRGTRRASLRIVTQAIWLQYKGLAGE